MRVADFRTEYFTVIDRIMIIHRHDDGKFVYSRRINTFALPARVSEVLDFPTVIAYVIIILSPIME